MNLARVLDVSLPELPKFDRERFFRFNPNMVWKQRTEKGITTIHCIGEQTRKVFTLTPDQWNLVNLFNGRHSCEQISRLYKSQYNLTATPDAVRSMAEVLDENGFWLRTPEEEMMAMMEQLKQRQKKVKNKSLKDFTQVCLFAVDHDPLITKVHRRIAFIYSVPFVLCSLAALLLMVGLWIARSDEVWRDSLLYWNATDKTTLDVLEFYFIFAIVGFFHESGHALTAKNFGAEVHRVGMMLVYTLPAFFVETTEATVHGNYFQRMYVILAGFWYELMLCAIATLIWWGTAVGGTVHNIAYKFILVGGIMPVIFNMNPLMRMDGYLFFTKMIREPRLKERSTAFLSGWVQNRIFGLQARVEPLPRRRAIFFATYAFLSGAYTYSVLLFLSRITYKAVHNFSPDWAFLPATIVALLIFRSRIQKFLTFLKAVYEHNRDVMSKHRFELGMAAVAIVVLLFLPIFRESISAPTMLEARQRAVLSAHVAGRVEQVGVEEGQTVSAGSPLIALTALDLQSEAGRARSNLQTAQALATSAQLHYADYGTAVAEQNLWAERAREAKDREQHLTITAPIAGVVVTPRIRDFLGKYVTEGTPMGEVDDLSVMRARIYVDETDVRTISDLTRTSVLLKGRIGSLHGTFESVSAQPEEPPPGLVDPSKFKGLRPPPHYVVSVLIPNDGTLVPGMAGDAKLWGKRQSLAGKIWHPIANFVGRKVW